MADLNQLNELHVSVRSRILEQINKSLEASGSVAASTQYTKSDGTNYGMYTKGDSSLTDLWDTVINQRSVTQIAPNIGNVAGPQG